MIQPIENWLTLDQFGVRMPWYTRPFLEILNEMDLKHKRVFEYGCGYSTLWYRSRGAKVHGVDSSKEWAEFAGITLVDVLETYIKMATLFSDYFDIVVIDGMYRDECTEYALEALTPEGILIIDNWMQPSVEPNDWTRTLALIDGMKIDVYKEPLHDDWKTAVIYKP